jgi:hypothetical protein
MELARHRTVHEASVCSADHGQQTTVSAAAVAITIGATEICPQVLQ